MIVIENLTKRYGDLVAVNDVSFVARPGSVTGFLGPNGAGKSTAMRMMTGLTPPTAGRALVLGRPYKQLPNPGRHVGVMLDASAQHPGRTGREVLRLAAIQMGVGRAAVDASLDRVGLTSKEAGRRVRNYSLGMRQRLGLASALMGDPQVLILDEPANGLDPQGIHWMRGLLRGFADQGGTVLLSSHLLHEVQIIADELVMIGNGRIVAIGSKEELLDSHGTRVRSLDDTALHAALSAAGFGVRHDGTVLVAEATPEQVGRVALDARIVLTELRTSGSEGLEEMFLQLTAAHAREGSAA
ncbi:ABC-type multidrug transport system ATPase component [Nostocoides japonicum T1-X7]|uniref:ABC-type multidrug transport system ATPase component n=1 Tax=Nostocoides japonicum T1-X7 TaxID=1194083 RepID=A0A077LST6_9MICO|nr:ATP-binding cassette domain-containing protein [Tetrasphaera japonica]CCH76238.1 ABC-type multidrug transport system ATPase component [Tetrasphaera japonica T1-X7]